MTDSKRGRFGFALSSLINWMIFNPLAVPSSFQLLRSKSHNGWKRTASLTKKPRWGMSERLLNFTGLWSVIELALIVFDMVLDTAECIVLTRHNKYGLRAHRQSERALSCLVSRYFFRPASRRSSLCANSSPRRRSRTSCATCASRRRRRSSPAPRTCSTAATPRSSAARGRHPRAGKVL